MNVFLPLACVPLLAYLSLLFLMLLVLSTENVMMLYLYSLYLSKLTQLHFVFMKVFSGFFFLKQYDRYLQSP